MNDLAWFVILAGAVIAVPASMFVAWLVGRAVELADAHAARRVEAGGRRG